MKKTILFALLFQLTLTVMASDTTKVSPAFLQEFANWELKELVKGGRIDAICDMGNGTVVAGTRHPNPGQLFISYNYGNNWQPLTHLTTSAITCIAAANSTEWYVLTGNAEVFGTRDAGKTWSLLSTLTTNKNKEKYTASYSILVTYQGTVLVTDTDSEGGHIYRSVDKGKSWTDLGAVSGDALYRFTKVGNGIIVNGWQGNVYKSIDDGLTWNIVGRLTDSDLFATDYLGSHRILQADKDGNIFRSENLGEEWKQIGKLPDAADDFIDLGYGAVIYSTYTGKRAMHLSLNYGTDWYEIGVVPSGVEGDWLDHGIRLDQQDSIIILAGTSKGHIIRKALSRNWLYKTVNSYQKRETGIKPELLKPLQKGLVSSLVNFSELMDPEDIVTHKQVAYIPCRDGNNVAIIDYKNPGKPVLAYSLRDPDILDAFSVAIHQDHLYVLSMTNSMVSVYNIRDPYHPVKTGSIKVGGEGGYLTTYKSNYTRLRKIAVQGNYAYVTHSSESKLYVLDISNPAKPAIVSSIHTGDGAFAVLPSGEVVYLAGYGPGSSVIAVDVRNKKTPRISSKIYDSTLLAGTCALAIKDKILYVVAYSAGKILSVDISDPLHMKPISYFSESGMKGPGRIAISGETAYVINSSNDSMLAIDISDPATMKTRYFIQDPLIKKTYGIALDGDKILLAGRDARSFVIVDGRKLE
jgi:photosystem II stability/assembly factor-like uncharacterized protein